MSNYGLIRFKRFISCANWLDCVISYFFQLHLILYVCVQTFNVTGTVENFLELNWATGRRRSKFDAASTAKGKTSQLNWRKGRPIGHRSEGVTGWRHVPFCSCACSDSEHECATVGISVWTLMVLVTDLASLVGADGLRTESCDIESDSCCVHF